MPSGVFWHSESSLSRESSLSMEQHTRVGGENSHLTSSLVAHHFKVWFVCFWQQRDRCLKLEPFARNFLAFNETLRIQGSLPCEMKSQLKSPSAGSFQKDCLFPICLQSEVWMVFTFGSSYSCQQSHPQLLQGFEGLLLVQAPTHFRRFSWLFLSQWNKALPQPARIRGRTARIYLLPRII